MPAEEKITEEKNESPSNIGSFVFRPVNTEPTIKTSFAEQRFKPRVGGELTSPSQKLAESLGLENKSLKRELSAKEEIEKQNSDALLKKLHEHEALLKELNDKIAQLKISQEKSVVEISNEQKKESFLATGVLRPVISSRNFLPKKETATIEEVKVVPIILEETPAVVNTIVAPLEEMSVVSTQPETVVENNNVINEAAIEQPKIETETIKPETLELKEEVIPQQEITPSVSLEGTPEQIETPENHEELIARINNNVGKIDHALEDSGLSNKERAVLLANSPFLNKK